MENVLATSTLNTKWKDQIHYFWRKLQCLCICISLPLCSSYLSPYYPIKRKVWAHIINNYEEFKVLISPSQHPQKMIESCYWKEDLLSHAKRLKPVKKPKRWSERLVVNFEKEIIISFFCIRKLFETHKLSSATKDYKANIFAYRASGKKITNLNHFSIDTLYDLENEKKSKKSIIFIANQLIHSCTLFSFRDETRNWDCILACSDFERNKTIYRIPVKEIITILKLVGNDYPDTVTMTWSDKLDDYEVHAN